MFIGVVGFVLIPTATNDILTTSAAGYGWFDLIVKSLSSEVQKNTNHRYHKKITHDDSNLAISLLPPPPPPPRGGKLKYKRKMKRKLSTTFEERRST